MRVYTTEKLGDKRSRTPEKFLLCQDVPIARTGRQLYGPGETPIEPGPNGVTYIDRTEEEVFRKETIDSFNGKPVVNDHPKNDDGSVDPDNWKDLAVGVVMNVRRGGAFFEDCILADLLITDAQAIEDVEAGKREVSCGYGCDYMQTAPGFGYQKNIIGNHVALVEAGRCGPRCSIKDHAHQTQDKEGAPMKITLDSFITNIKSKFTAAGGKDTKALDAALQGVTVQDGEVHIHENAGGSKFTDDDLEQRFAAYDSKHKTHDDAIAGVRGRVDALEKAAEPVQTVTDEDKEKAEKEAEEKKSADEMAEEVAEEKKVDVQGAKDSAMLADSFQNTLAVAEILCPGIRVPTFDSAAKPVSTFKAICNLRRKALDSAIKDENMAAALKEIRGGRATDSAEVRTAPCSNVRDWFFALGTVKKVANNATPAIVVGAPMGTKTLSLAELNKRNHEHYKG